MARSHERATEPYSEPDESIPQHYIVTNNLILRVAQNILTTNIIKT
jgi:hypothetical protein